MFLSPQIIYQDQDLLVLHKPARFYVHPPEQKWVRHRVGRNTCIHWLTDHHEIKGYPIHRLDFATEGLVLFALDHHCASLLNQSMRAGEIQKYYDVIVRGWFKDSEGEILLPLELDSTGELVSCQTNYKTISTTEFNYAVNPAFTTSRYSWLDIELKTGRWHQIRRHMNRVSHPVIGDREHGDSHHNRFFRDQLGVDGLCLKAKRLEFIHPTTLKKIIVECPMTDTWKKLDQIFNLKNLPALSNSGSPLAFFQNPEN